eukprot:g1118.t1
MSTQYNCLLNNFATNYGFKLDVKNLELSKGSPELTMFPVQHFYNDGTKEIVVPTNDASGQQVSFEWTLDVAYGTEIVTLNDGSQYKGINLNRMAEAQEDSTTNIESTFMPWLPSISPKRFVNPTFLGADSVNSGKIVWDVENTVVGMYNGAVTVEGQFGATSVGDFMIQVRAPPKYCTGGTCMDNVCQNTQCTSDSDCSSCGGTCSELSAPKIYSIFQENEEITTCTKDSHADPNCIKTEFEFNTCGDIIVNVKATSEAGVGYVETVGLPLSDYWTDDRDTTTIGATGSIDFNGKLNFTAASQADAGKTYRMCLKPISCGSYVVRGEAECIDITFTNQQLSLSVTSPGDLSACASTDVLYIDTATTAGVANSVNLDVCGDDDTCASISSDVASSGACDTSTGFCSQSWTLDSSLNLLNPVYLKATSANQPTCYQESRSNTFTITKPSLPIQVVAPSSSGCGGSSKWYRGCTEYDGVSLTTLNTNANISVSLTQGGSTVDQVGQIGDWTGSTGSIDYFVPLIVSDDTDYRLSLVDACFAEFVSETFEIDTWPLDAASISITNTATGSYANTNGKPTWMQGAANDIELNVTVAIDHSPMTVTYCYSQCSSCGVDPPVTVVGNAEGYASTGPASFQISTAITNHTGDICLIASFKDQLDSCGTYGMVDMHVAPWDANTITNIGAQDSSTGWDSACGGAYTITWDISSEASAAGISAAAYLHLASESVDVNANPSLTTSGTAFDLTGLVDGNYKISFVATDSFVPTREISVQISSGATIALEWETPTSDGQEIYGCELIPANWRYASSGSGFQFELKVCDTAACDANTMLVATNIVNTNYDFRLNMTGLNVADGGTAYIVVSGTTACVPGVVRSFTYRTYPGLVLEDVGGTAASANAGITFQKCFPDYLNWATTTGASTWGGVEARLVQSGADAQTFFGGTIGTSGIATVGSSVAVGAYDLTIGPTDDNFDSCVATSSVGVTVSQYAIDYTDAQLLNGGFSMTEPCVYDISFTANTARIGYLAMEIRNKTTGAVVATLGNQTREQRLESLSSVGVEPGTYDLVVLSVEKSPGCVREAVTNVTVLPAELQCLDTFAANYIPPEDTSGVPLEVILGIAIPFFIVVAVCIVIGLLYYLKKKRDASRATDVLVELDTPGVEATATTTPTPMLDPFAGDDVWDDSANMSKKFYSESSRELEEEKMLHQKEELIKARKEELDTLIRHLSRRNSGKRMLRREGLVG